MSWRYRIVMFVIVLVIHGAGPAVQVTDSRLLVVSAVSLVREGDLDLDEFKQVTSLTDKYDVVEVDGHTLWGYPYGPILFILPAVLAAEVLPGVDAGDLSVSAPNRTWLLEVPTASVLTAFAVLLFHALALQVTVGEWTHRRRVALLSTIAFGFGTSMWSTAPRAMWQHTPSVMLVTACALVAVRGRARLSPRAAFVLGGLLALAFTMRPTNALAGVGLGLWVAVRHRRSIPAFLLGTVPVAVAFIAINRAVFGELLHPYFVPGKLGGTTDVPAALAGTLIAPSRGLLLLSPILLLVPVGLMIRRRTRDLVVLDSVFLAVCIAHWLLIARWPNWWGGSSFGARLFVDVLPFLCYFLVPVVDRTVCVRREGARLVPAVVMALLGVSALVHFNGAYVRATFCWNATPQNIESAPERNWDWDDPQVLRGARDLLAGVPPRQVIAGSCSASSSR